MSQTASFLTDYLFPGLLIGCGCLGLGVVNALAQGALESPRSASEDGAAGRPQGPQAMSPPAKMAAKARPASAVMRQRPAATSRVVPLRRVARPTRHQVRFTGRTTRVSDVERERLRVFLAAAQPGARARLMVVGHPRGRRGKRRARRRARRVVRVLRKLGVAKGSIASPRVVSGDGPVGGAVTITIGER